jgi:hypothetical protein
MAALGVNVPFPVNLWMQKPPVSFIVPPVAEHTALAVAARRRRKNVDSNAFKRI